MSRVLAFSRDPGGANTVIPLVKPLRERGYDVRLFGKDMALAKYRLEGLDGVDVLTELSAIKPDTVRHFIRSVSPDAVVTGTSADDFTEKYIWRASEELGIPSLAIVDQWSNYGLRFSGHGVNDISVYAREKTHPYLPSRIVALDDYARMEMIGEGLPAERIVACGQPYFETVLARREDLGKSQQFCSASGIASEDFLVLFASEPITSTYGPGALAYWGYTERTILSSLVRAVEKVAEETERSVVLVVRPHPKEGSEHFLDIVAQCDRIRCLFDMGNSPWMLMKRADLVCGMSSMFLIESIIFGRPVLSVQIGLCREDPFVLSRRGTMRSVMSEGDLIARLRSSIIHGMHEIPAFEVIRNPVERIIVEMERLLCHDLR